MLTAHQVLHGYTQGIFPMADPEEDDAIFWYEPEMRGVIIPSEFHIPKNLKKLYQKNIFECRINSDFLTCIQNCSNRDETWISDEIIDVYHGLHKLGYGFSFEAWLDGEMVGGLYGIAMGKVFFGESMFHKVSNASKIALLFLMEWVIENGIELVDCQFINNHLLQFGAKEIPQKEFIQLLNKSFDNNWS
jgi:leucyl/phenylalanyl-tRNA---protein transferase